MSNEAETLANLDALKIMAFSHDVSDTERLIGWMDALIGENVTLQVALVEGPDEERVTRISHLASQISAYRRIKDAATRALALAKGNKPPERLAPVSAEGAVL